MNEAKKTISLNLHYSYLMIAKDNVIKDKYSELKQVIFKDLENIK